MEKVTRPYYKNKRLILGSGKSQKGGFFLLAVALAPLAGEVIGKIFERGKKQTIKTKPIIFNERPHRSLRKIILFRKRYR